MNTTQLPPLFYAQQDISQVRIQNIEEHLQQSLTGSGVTVKPDERVAIAVGSRGIANLPLIVAGVVKWVRQQGAQVFIVPAMGSHGGASAAGQEAVLECYGITEEAMRAPIVSSMEVVELPRGDLPVPVFFDKCAFEADATILINRIKVHTDYHGPHESGLMKMAAIGLGKHKAALALHRFGVAGLRDLMPRVAHQQLRYGNIILGIGIVENAHEAICGLEAIPANQIPLREREMLEFSRGVMPRLPVDDLDILIVDEIGKNISGVGMDPSIIGRIRILGEPEPISPRIKTIVIRDLTAQSNGNALGMGLADIMTRKLRDKIDWDATYANAFTSTFLERVKMPLAADSDAEALALALRTCGSQNIGDVRMIRAVNTSCLDRLIVSAGVLQCLKEPGHLRVLGPVRHPWIANDLAPMTCTEGLARD